MTTQTNKYSAELIAEWLLSKSEMSPKKLQKMLYYCYSWTLTLLNEREDELKNKLFDDEFEAWVHGPVVRSVYDKYRPFGYTDIPKSDKAVPIDDEEVLDILHQVFDEYGAFSGNDLESISHQEDPWIIAREGKGPFEASDQTITDESIFNYYIQRVE
ncbi:MAG: DUF4065 domain-containing protein [Melioribacteraceae bacterium]|nr:DUF4065 domain-containing protein [Melioribacteraceae bacterium]